MWSVNSWKSGQGHTKRKGQAPQPVPGKLDTICQRTSLVIIDITHKTKNPIFHIKLFPSWVLWGRTCPLSTQLHTGNLSPLCPHFSLLQGLLAGGYWLNPAPVGMDAAPLSRSLSPDASQGDKAPLSCAGSQVKGHNVPVPCWSERWVWRPQWASREERGALRSHTPEASSQRQFCCGH